MSRSFLIKLPWHKVTGDQSAQPLNCLLATAVRVYKRWSKDLQESLKAFVPSRRDHSHVSKSINRDMWDHFMNKCSYCLSKSVPSQILPWRGFLKSWQMWVHMTQGVLFNLWGMNALQSFALNNLKLLYLFWADVTVSWQLPSTDSHQFPHSLSRKCVSSWEGHSSRQREGNSWYALAPCHSKL